MAATTTGTSGNDTLIGGSGADTLDGGAGSDFLNAGSGDDILRYVLSDNLAACKDIYIGGSGKDTLVIALTDAQWGDQSVKSQLFNYLNHLKAVTNAKTGEVSSGNASDYLFTFGSSTLSVQMVEKLKVVIGDRTVLDSTDTTATAPILSVTAVSGNEDAQIDLSGKISALLTDTDGTEWISGFRITGIPQGATLSNAAGNIAIASDGSVTLSPAQLTGLTIIPPHNSDVDFNLGVAAISTEMNGGVTATSSVKTLAVTVNAVADAPTLTVENAAGDEDAAIEIGSKIHAALTDSDGSESLTVTLTGIPDGASLSNGHGDLLVPANGAITLTAAQLAGLSITPPANSDQAITLQVKATSTEQNGGMQADSAVQTLNITVNAVADQPTLSVTSASGNEDQTIDIGSHISAALTDTDGSETLKIWIQGIPEGAQLMLKDGTVLTLVDGNTLLEATPLPGTIGSGVLLDPEQLDGLSILPAKDSDADFQLKVGAVSIEDSGSIAGNGLKTLSVTVNAVADMPNLSVAPASGDEDTAIAIGDKITASLADTDHSESLLVMIDGIPEHAVVRDGDGNALAPSSGKLTLTVEQLAGLTITPPQDSDDEFDLVVTATATEASNGDSATTAPQVLSITVSAVADLPTLEVGNTVGDEDSWIPVGARIDAHLLDLDGSESLTITISGIPDGATLRNAGGDVAVPDGGSITLDAIQLVGLEIKPPHDSGTDFDLSISATATEQHDGAAVTTSTYTMNVEVNAVADAPDLVVDAVNGDEDMPIAIGDAIHAQLTDTDGSETLTVHIDGVPDGATLLDGNGDPIVPGPQGYVLDVAQLAGLSIVPPADSDKEFSLNITAISTEQENGAVAKTGPYTLMVAVNAIADVPTLTVDPAAGNEDLPIEIGDKIHASVTDLDGSESISGYRIIDIPEGATLANNNGPLVVAADGSINLSPSDLDGLVITPPSNSDADIHLGVAAYSTEINGGSTAASLFVPLVVTVNAVADAPTLTVGSASGNEDQSIEIGSKIHVALVDADSSESLLVTISGIPSGATLTNTDNNLPAVAGTSVTLTVAQLAGLSIKPPLNSDVDFNLSVSATSTETNGGDVATTGPLSLAVTVNAVADLPTLAVSPASGDANTSIALGSHISAALTDTDLSESLTITLAGIPSGATFTNTLGSSLVPTNGVLTVTAAQLDGLAIKPPLNSDADFNLSVTATSTELNGGNSVTTAPKTLAVTVNDIVVTPQGLTLNGTGGNDTFHVGVNNGQVSISDPAGGNDSLVVDTVSGTSFSTFNFERVGDNLVLSLGSGGGTSTVTVQNHFAAGNLGVESVSFLNGGTAYGYNLGTAGYNLQKDLSGAGQADVIASSALGQSLGGGNGNDLLFGNDGNDTADGGAGNDLLVGGAGNDRLIGGDGNDVLVGGPGSDTFVFNTAPNAAGNVDAIKDFNANGEDFIELAAATFSGLSGTGNLNAGDFTTVAGTGATANFTGNSNVNIIFDTSTGNLYYDSNGGDATGRTLIATLTVPAGTVDATDFKVV